MSIEASPPASRIFDESGKFIEPEGLRLLNGVEDAVRTMEDHMVALSGLLEVLTQDKDNLTSAMRAASRHLIINRIQLPEDYWDLMESANTLERAEEDIKFMRLIAKKLTPNAAQDTAIAAEGTLPLDLSLPNQE